MQTIAMRIRRFDLCPTAVVIDFTLRSDAVFGGWFFEERNQGFLYGSIRSAVLKKIQVVGFFAPRRADLP